MIDFLIKALPFLGGALAIFFFGRSQGKKKADKVIREYKGQTEEIIRQAEEEKGKAIAEAEAGKKESNIIKAASASVKPEKEVKKIAETTREGILSAIGDMIQESKHEN